MNTNDFWIPVALYIFLMFMFYAISVLTDIRQDVRDLKRDFNKCQWSIYKIEIQTKNKGEFYERNNNSKNK